VKVGRVALVGAGPGDPGLLTLRAAELIRVADVVAHDELISEAILAMVPARAELLAVGRRVGAGEAPHRLHPEVKARALRGQNVVRLKAGDPLIFGRGGEEAEELAEAGIEFEIVPGITAAVGAAAYSGIPLTHRAHSAQLVIGSGHRLDGGLVPGAPVGGRTLVLYMSTRELAANLSAVVANGWPSSTAAVLIASATNPDERVVRGTLATLAELSRLEGVPRLGQPALVIVGDVAEPRGTDWRRRLPLFGKTIVVARARPGTSEIGRRFRDLGAIAIELPHVEKGTATRLSLAVNDASDRDVALLSSVEAVEAWLDSGLGMPTIALGSEVAALLRAAKRPPIFTLRGACLNALQEAQECLSGRRVFVPIAAGSRTTLSEPLSAVGATPVIVAIAGHQSFAPARWPVCVDLVVLPSSLAALALYSEAPASILKTPALAMGPQSAKQASRSGASEVRTAARDTIESLVASAVESLTPMLRGMDAPGSVAELGGAP
jgi:uroporphyrinogen III methyltransferase/synthase